MIIGRSGSVHAYECGTQIGNQLAKGLAQRFALTDQHIVMRGLKVTRASCHSRAKTALDAIALWRIARLLGDGEADAGIRLRRGDSLQAKRRTPGAIAPGGPLKLVPLGQPAQGARLMLAGRHPAMAP